MQGSDRETLVCPQCGSSELATVEDLTGYAKGSAYMDSQGERHFEPSGWTDVFWDSSVSQAVTCRDCDWEQKAAHDGPALDELVVEGQDDYVDSLDPYELRVAAEVVVGEDRVPVDVLRDLVKRYGKLDDETPATTPPPQANS